MGSSFTICYTLWLISPSYILQNGGGPANGPAGDQGAALLVPNIDDMRTAIQGMNLKIPIGNADAGAYFNNKVLAAIDYGVRTMFSGFIFQISMTAIDGQRASMVWRRSNCRCGTVDHDVLPKPRCRSSQSGSEQATNVHRRDR